MRQVKVGPEGIRGKVGGSDKGLDLEQTIDLASAFATWIGGGPVLIARDTRPSSPMLASAVKAALSAAGCQVLDAGICPTAAAQIEAGRLEAAGMISITGAHNDEDWNGLKLFGEAGQILSSAEGREILDVLHQEDYLRAVHSELGDIRPLDDPFHHYLDRLTQWVDREAIARAGLRVVVDACNGAASVMVDRLCEALGVELIPVNCDPDGRFPHPPDPTTQNLATVAAIVPPVEAAVGFGLSADCSRVALVTDRGTPLGREASLALIADHIFAGPRRPEGDPAVVVGANCDSRIFQVAARHGARTLRCGVGALAVAEQTMLQGAALGGDNSGGVLVPDFHFSFDGLASMALMLEAVAAAGGSQPLADGLPPVHLRTATVLCPISRAYTAVTKVRELAIEGRGPGAGSEATLSAAKVSDLDGVLVELEGGWYHVRVAHTEPLIRITCEAKTDADCRELIAQLKNAVQGALQGR